MAYIGQAVFYHDIIINNIYSPHRLISPRLKEHSRKITDFQGAGVPH